MKNLPLIFLLFFFYSVKAQSQTVQLNEQSLVKDIAGNIIPSLIWKAYIKTGDYGIKQNAKTNEFIFFELTPEEKQKAKELKLAKLEGSAKPRSSGSFKDGEKFRGDKFTDINGIKYDLKQLTGKILVFNFWFINCPPCKEEIPELNILFQKYKDQKDVIFLAIALDEKYELKEFTKHTPFLYSIVANGSYYAEKYNVKSFPTHVVVGKDGLVKFQTSGLAFNTVYWVEKTLKEQLSAF